MNSELIVYIDECFNELLLDGHSKSVAQYIVLGMIKVDFPNINEDEVKRYLYNEYTVYNPYTVWP